MNLPDPWKFFTKVYCISLDSRIDRREQAKKHFSEVGLLDRVEFVIVARHPENREKGIFESHMRCLAMGLAAGARHILIFEDDVFFRGFDPQALNEACSALARLEAWNGLFLGCITTGSRTSGSRFLAEIRYRCLAHAYALNAPFAQDIVRHEWNGIPFDELLRHHNADFFALCPMCAFQGHSGSDNQTVAIDRLRRFFGGLPFIQKTNETYQNNKMFFLIAHLAAFLLIAAVAVKLW